MAVPSPGSALSPTLCRDLRYDLRRCHALSALSPWRHGYAQRAPRPLPGIAPRPLLPRHCAAPSSSPAPRRALSLAGTAPSPRPLPGAGICGVIFGGTPSPWRPLQPPRSRAPMPSLSRPCLVQQNAEPIMGLSAGIGEVGAELGWALGEDPLSEAATRWRNTHRTIPSMAATSLPRRAPQWSSASSPSK
uniref:Uncharacterized protein n=1 Tax=Ananas comosus var. bracteatus TaxID=296719 RepID=A0A6V7PSM5_ANACO|nr:unnamed protein product [Ananas comosus var. bracteatus]